MEKRVIFLVRDPRDVVVSFYHHNQKRMSFLDGADKNISEFIRHPRLGVPRIIEYMNFFYENRSVFKKFEIVRYRDLKQDSSNFRRIVSFLGLSFSEESFKYALTQSEFSKMRKAEVNQEVGEHLLTPGDQSDPNSFKVRKGRVGGYKTELNEEDQEYCIEQMKLLNPVFRYSSELFEE